MLRLMGASELAVLFMATQLQIQNGLCIQVSLTLRMSENCCSLLAILTVSQVVAGDVASAHLASLTVEVVIIVDACCGAKLSSHMFQVG